MHRECLRKEFGDEDHFFCQGCQTEIFNFKPNRTVRTPVKNSPGVQYVRNMFDKPQAEAAVTFELAPMPKLPPYFDIGVICGSSGSGKRRT